MAGEVFPSKLVFIDGFEGGDMHGDIGVPSDVVRERDARPACSALELSVG